MSLSDIWELDRFQYLWPSKDTHPALFKNFTIEQLAEEMKVTPVKHAVFVQVQNNKPEEIGKCIYYMAITHIMGVFTTYNPSRAVAVLRCFRFHPVAVLKRRILSTF